MIKTPKELGYYMPAEWEEHSAVWLAWPIGDYTFPNILDQIEKDYCKIIKELKESEKVKLIILNDSERKRIEKILEENRCDLNNIEFFTEDYADVWTRDYSPITLFDKNNNKIAQVKWEYNAYGRAHDPRFIVLLKDNKVFDKIIDQNKIEIFRPWVVLEGGAIESNGQGVILTTEQCLLNENRNENMSKERMETYLKDYLGAKKVIWLKDGLLNDHTDGHVDEIARFVAPNTIVCAYEDDINDPNFLTLDENFKILEKETDENGNKYKIIKMPIPHMEYEDGEKAPVSYTNFYIGNSIVLMSIFNDRNDKKAIEIVQSIFLDKKVIGLDCSKIIYGGGAIHCLTMQEY